jgi:paraquat-inducible protein B
MTSSPMFDEFRKAQEILAETIDKTARANMASVEKLFELNRASFARMQDITSPADFIARQSSVFKEYAEQVNQQFEELTAIGNESREQLTELGQAMTRNLDVTSLFDFAPKPARAKAKPASKAA